MVTTEETMQAMAKTTHPEICCRLIGLGMIKHVSAERDKVMATANLRFPMVPITDGLARIVTEAVADEDQTSQVEGQFSTLNQEEREEFMKNARDKWKL